MTAINRKVKHELTRRRLWTNICATAMVRGHTTEMASEKAKNALSEFDKTFQITDFNE